MFQLRQQYMLIHLVVVVKKHEYDGHHNKIFEIRERELLIVFFYGFYDVCSEKRNSVDLEKVDGETESNDHRSSDLFFLEKITE
jgi:hypothetical protein